MPPVWKPIKEIIRKPIKWIGDTIEDIGDWVVDEIIDPIVNIVEGTIDAMLDDPIKTIATIALLASPTCLGSAFIRRRRCCYEWW
jgi:hypothetical protein